MAQKIERGLLRMNEKLLRISTVVKCKSIWERMNEKLLRISAMVKYKLIWERMNE